MDGGLFRADFFKKKPTKISVIAIYVRVFQALYRYKTFLYNANWDETLKRRESEDCLENFRNFITTELDLTLGG